MERAFEAVENGDFTALKEFFASGGDVDSVARGRTLLHVACDKKMDLVAEYLIREKANVNAPDDMGYTPLHDACLRGMRVTVAYLLSKGANACYASKLGVTPLHFATSRDTASALLDCGASVFAMDEFGDTPLHCACRTGCVALVALLLEKGALVASLNIHKRTPLHVTSSPEVARLLLEKGADVDARDGYGETPLHVALTHGDLDMIRLLLEKSGKLTRTETK